MASTYSSALRLELITPGEQANTWGGTTNTNLGTLIEQAISGYATIDMVSDADRVLTMINGGPDESRPAALKITSSVSLTATRHIVVPTVNKLYSVKNATTGGQVIIIKTAAGSGISIPNGETATVICDGADVVYGFTPVGMGVPTTYAASAITNTPAGTIGATNVQAALNELDTEKANISGATFTGGVNTARGSIAMHATAMNLWGQPNIIDGTGSAVTIAAIANAPQAGTTRKLYPIAGTIITHGATFDVEGGANYTTVAGDGLTFEAITTSTYKVWVDKDNVTGIITNSKNLIVNGGFTINQRNYVSAEVLSSESYGHDRWKAGSGGGDYSFTQLASNTQITISANKTLIQVIENANVQHTNYILSWTGTAQARIGLNSSTPSGGYASSPILITGQTAGQPLSVEFGNGASAGTLANVQVETGSVAGTMEYRSIQQELELCLRYFIDYKNCLFQYNDGVTRTAQQTYRFPVRMRTTPTMAGTVWAGSPSFTNQSDIGFSFSGTTTATGQLGYTAVTASAEL